MKETKYLEYKESVANTFLKTVSAFSNYEGGKIVFGVADDGTIKGFSDPTSTCLDIENKINDSISPQADYTLSVKESDNTILLEVKPGINKPYLYKSKAYKRNDTATIEVDTLEFSRLVLQGRNIKYEELSTDNENLTFLILEERLKALLGIEKMSMDILKTLNLYSDKNGYNNAAAILADINTFPGIDIAKFGENISIINKRATFDKMSIIGEYENSINLFRDYYQYEEISGSERKKVERIPEAAFREAIANALIHRTWDIDSQIRVLMFDDRIEITSPGGLPEGISREEYLAGKTSVLRNPILANVFYRLGIVEIFGTGVLRILQMYSENMKKPLFEIGENTIKVTLPIIEENLNLTDNERQIYNALSKTMPKSISEIMESVEFGKSKVSGILKDMNRKGILYIEGKGRGTKYHI